MRKIIPKDLCYDTANVFIAYICPFLPISSSFFPLHLPPVILQRPVIAVLLLWEFLMKFIVWCLFWKIMVSTINRCCSFIIRSFKKIVTLLLGIFWGNQEIFQFFSNFFFSQLFYQEIRHFHTENKDNNTGNRMENKQLFVSLLVLVF